MPTAFTYEDSLRAHDYAVVDWLRGCTVDYGTVAGVARPAEPILAVMAAPHQAFAAVSDILVSKGWISGADDAARRANAEGPDYAVLPLPFVSMERRDSSVSTLLAGVPKRERKICFNHVSNQWEIHPYPGEWITPYDITVWSLKRYSDNYVREWVMGQLGQLGKMDAEILLPVHHREPWGTMLQQFKLTGMADLSELEGEKQRYIRTQFTFDLRTWVMKKAITYAYPVLFPSAERSVDGTQDEIAAPPTVSPNLFLQPYHPDVFPQAWPKEGDATVALADGGLDVVVADENDAIPLADVAAAPAPDNGTAVVEVALDYRLPGALPVVLELTQKDMAGNVTVSHELLLSPSVLRRKVHLFAVVAGSSWRTSVVGTAGGTPRTVELREIAIRQVLNLDRVGATATVDLGAAIRYTWSNLSTAPYLVIGVLRPAVGGTGMATVGDDATTPVTTRTASVDAAVNTGFALLTQPLTSTLRLDVPKTLNLVAVYAIRYGGYYHGHEL